ncbi:RNA polymerase sigma factor [Niabella hibiscisoli]|uniref:RNA polymerase sigma factor n=1 Tax=Niabella hibiscisoli TaxID=1825928 RepID=UPI00293E55B2|nr:sigma-70 family RNA polymerase sigma factor [Niabella hibiscisoli]
MEALPEGFRTIVNLYVMEGIPQQEIAELLGISHATVRTQYHRAKKKILTLLQKETV